MESYRTTERFLLQCEQEIEKMQTFRDAFNEHIARLEGFVKTQNSANGHSPQPESRPSTQVGAVTSMGSGGFPMRKGGKKTRMDEIMDAMNKLGRPMRTGELQKFMNLRSSGTVSGGLTILVNRGLIKKLPDGSWALA